MPATPKRGRRFGGNSQHQRLIMANLVASLVASPTGIVTTEAKAKAVRPIAEKIITKAKKGGLHNRQADGRDRPPLRQPSRRVHAHPQARHPPG